MQCNWKCNSLVPQVQIISHWLPVSSGFHFHTHAFRSPLRVSIAQRAVRDVTPAHAASRRYRSKGAVWRRRPGTAEEWAHAPDKIGRNGGKGEILWAHIYPTASSRRRGRRVQSLVPIDSEMWICIRYKLTFIFLYIYIYIYIVCLMYSFYC